MIKHLATGTACSGLVACLPAVAFAAPSFFPVLTWPKCESADSASEAMQLWRCGEGFFPKVDPRK